jgi:hypothetical protein
VVVAGFPACLPGLKVAGFPACYHHYLGHVVISGIIAIPGLFETVYREQGRR